MRPRGAAQAWRAQTRRPETIYMCVCIAKQMDREAVPELIEPNARMMVRQLDHILKAAQRRGRARWSDCAAATQTDAEGEAGRRVHLETLANTWGGYLQHARGALGMSGGGRRR
jgi:hypothetical protein